MVIGALAAAMAEGGGRDQECWTGKQRNLQKFHGNGREGEQIRKGEKLGGRG